MKAMELNASEIRMLIQSLEHCLETCHNNTKSGPCPDCQAAKALRQRLEAQLAA